MPVREARPPAAGSRLPQALVIGVSLALVLALAGCWLTSLAMYHRVLPIPAFAIEFGGLELSGPCPKHGFDCDKDLSYYALWRGRRLPDHSLQYDQIFFVYLKPKQR